MVSIGFFHIFKSTEGCMKNRKNKRQLNKRLSLELKAWEWTIQTIRGRKVELVIYPSSPMAGMLARFV